MGLTLDPWIDLARNVIRAAVHRPGLPPAGVADDDFWDGADDTWPPEVGNIAEIPSEPEIIVSQQWGLRLPGGNIAWNGWQGHSFEHPLDRLKAIASLQKTALDLGYTQENSFEFLVRYRWVTRQMIASVVYEETGEHELNAPEVSAVGTSVTTEGEQ
jgi:hypothetical protein